MKEKQKIPEHLSQDRKHLPKFEAYQAIKNGAISDQNSQVWATSVKINKHRSGTNKDMYVPYNL